MVIVKSSSLLKLEMCEETQFTLACFKLIYLKEFKKVTKFDLKLIHTLLLIQVTLMKFITEEHTVGTEYLARVVLTVFTFALSVTRKICTLLRSLNSVL